MDSAITAAGRALRAGDPLGALNRVALRDDPAALALRGIAMAQLGDLDRARVLLRRAARGFGPREAVARARMAALCAEVERAGRALALPAARLASGGDLRSLTLGEVEALLAAPVLVVDGCRRTARRADRVVELARRPVLFGLLRGLAEAWPGEARREALIERAFEARRPNPSHRARLRVEMGRLRRELRPLAEVRATAAGFALLPRGARAVTLLAPPIESPDAAVLALL